MNRRSLLHGMERALIGLVPLTVAVLVTVPLFYVFTASFTSGPPGDPAALHRLLHNHCEFAALAGAIAAHLFAHQPRHPHRLATGTMNGNEGHLAVVIDLRQPCHLLG